MEHADCRRRVNLSHSGLQRILSHATEQGKVWSCWRTSSSDTWLFTCEMSMPLSRKRGTPVLQVCLYDLEIPSIKPGLTESALLQSTEFVDAEGKNFDPYTDRIATLDLDCETPEGHRYYSGRFGLKNSASR